MLACVIFPYRTSTNALPKITLHHQGNLMHARFHSIVKEYTRPSPFPKTMSYHEGKNDYIASWSMLSPNFLIEINRFISSTTLQPNILLPSICKYLDPNEDSIVDALCDVFDTYLTVNSISQLKQIIEVETPLNVTSLGQFSFQTFFSFPRIHSMEC